MTVANSFCWKRLIRRFGDALVCLLGLPLMLWAMGAFWYDLPLPAVGRQIAAVVLFLTLGFLWFPKKAKRRLIAAGIFVIVLGWWFTLSPSNDRDWQTDVSKTARAEIRGDEVTLPLELKTIGHRSLRSDPRGQAEPEIVERYFTGASRAARAFAQFRMTVAGTSFWLDSSTNRCLPSGAIS